GVRLDAHAQYGLRGPLRAREGRHQGRGAVAASAAVAVAAAVEVATEIAIGVAVNVARGIGIIVVVEECCRLCAPPPGAADIIDPGIAREIAARRVAVPGRATLLRHGRESAAAMVAEH